MKNQRNRITNFIILSVFYTIPKFAGIIPFNFSQTPVIMASESVKSYWYSVICSVGVTILLPFAQLVMNNDFNFIKTRKFTSALVFMLQVICSSLRVIITYYASVFYRKILIRVVNKNYSLYKSFRRHNAVINDHFFDSNFRFAVQMRVFSLACQVVVIFTPLIEFSRQMSLTTDEVLPFHISFIFILYTHFATAIVGLSHFLMMNVAAQFYRHWNKLMQIAMKNFMLLESHTYMSNKFKKQVYCNLSDECDNLNVLLKNMTNNFTDLNKHSSVFLLVSLIQCFVVLLSEVSIRVAVSKTILFHI